MSRWAARPALRWLVPVSVAALAIGGGVAAGAIAGAAESELPPRTAAELLVDLQTAQVDGLSGTVVQTADLGLPALPETRGSGSADLGTLWSGSNTLRVWVGGPDQQRVALLGTLGQSDIIRNGQDLWIWESRENRASHRVLPAGVEDWPARAGEPTMTPQQAADAALAALDPSTAVTTGNQATVADRSAYELVLAPRDESSLIRQVRLAIDGEHKIPLAVTVYGPADEPALEVRFTQISFAQPDPEQFQFNPPPGATVTDAELLPWLPFDELLGSDRPIATAVVGEGWTSVLVIALPVEQLKLAELSWLLAELPTVEGDWGSGQVLSTNLLSALLTDDGRMLIGAVTVERLAEAADDPAAALVDE